LIFILTSIQEDIELFFGVYTELFTVSLFSKINDTFVRISFAIVSYVLSCVLTSALSSFNT
jgi:hypothetical protein